MPEALATTKRKFTKLLDSISNISPAVTPSAETSTSQLPSIRPPSILPPGSERAAKRIKSTSTLSGATFASSVRSTRSIASTKTSLSRRLPTSSKPRQHTSSITSEKPPNFSPWSHETFLQRLKTFSSVSTWHPKPDALSEVEWAKRGWVCVDVNTVGCRGGCEKRVVVKLDADRPTQSNDHEEQQEVDLEAEEALEKALVVKYQELIVDGHSQNCLWRKAGCKDDIYRLTLVRPAIWQPELRARYHSLITLHASIKDISIKTVDTSSDPKALSAEQLLQDLPPSILASESPTEAIANRTLNSKAFSIAMHGWRGSTESGNDLLNCDACFQRIGLWMYQADYQRRSGIRTKTKEPGPWGYVSPPSEEPSQTQADSGKDGDDEDEAACIDLVEMHRSHCPYRNADTQLASGTLAGLNACEILQRVVSTYAREQRRRRDEQKRLDALVAQDPAGVAGDAEADGEGGDGEVNAPPVPRAEVERLDKERESKLRRLKRVFMMKKRAPVAKT